MSNASRHHCRGTSRRTSLGTVFKLTAPTEELFVRGAAQDRAKQVCKGCPARTECLAEALDNGIEWGFWGGMTERASGCAQAATERGLVACAAADGARGAAAPVLTVAR